MFRSQIGVILAVLAAGGVPCRAATPADASPKASWQQVAPDETSSQMASYDHQAEQQLLILANHDRTSRGLPPLKMDEGLVRAARAHAAEMASKNQLSHQFPGEPALLLRLAAMSPVHLNRAGENVALAANPEEAHQALMASPPHRDNLLNAEFNVAGFGVFRRGHMLYVAQDFGSSAPSYSVQQAQDMVSASVEQLRHQMKMPRLERVDSRSTQSSACAMAQA